MAPGRPLRIGLVGTGFIGAAHAGALAEAPGAELVAAASAHAESARRFTERLGHTHPGLRSCGDLDELLASDLDAVAVAVPTHLHEEVACAALAAGHHVLVEKPMALSLEGCDRMIAAAGPGQVLMVGLVVRHWPHYRVLRELAAGRAYGALRSVFSSRRVTFPRWSEWFADHRRSGGAVLDLVIHDLDFAVALCGRPRAVHAVGRRGPSGGWDLVQALIEGEDADASVEGMAVDAPGYPFSIESRLVFEHGLAELRGRSGGSQVDELGGPTLEVFPAVGGCRRPAVPDGDPYALQMRAFVDACLDRSQLSEGTPAQGREAVRLALTVRAALESPSHRIDFPPPE